MKASVVCGENDDGLYVKQARYFDRQGRGLANEENTPGSPERSTTLEFVYEQELGPPVREVLYDGNGVVLSSRAFASSGPAGNAPQPTGRIRPGTYHEYARLCREKPGAILERITGGVDAGRQFFEDACDCIAERVLRLDPTADAAFMAERGLDPASKTDHLALAAARDLSKCLCAEVIPGTALEDLCRRAPDVESHWRRSAD